MQRIESPSVCSQPTSPPQRDQPVPTDQEQRNGSHNALLTPAPAFQLITNHTPGVGGRSVSHIRTIPQIEPISHLNTSHSCGHALTRYTPNTQYQPPQPNRFGLSSHANHQAHMGMNYPSEYLPQQRNAEVYQHHDPTTRSPPPHYDHRYHQSQPNQHTNPIAPHNARRNDTNRDRRCENNHHYNHPNPNNVTILDLSSLAPPLNKKNSTDSPSHQPDNPDRGMKDEVSELHPTQTPPNTQNNPAAPRDQPQPSQFVTLKSLIDYSLYANPAYDQQPPLFPVSPTQGGSTTFYPLQVEQHPSSSAVGHPHQPQSPQRFDFATAGNPNRPGPRNSPPLRQSQDDNWAAQNCNYGHQEFLDANNPHHGQDPLRSSLDLSSCVISNSMPRQYPYNEAEVDFNELELGLRMTGSTLQLGDFYPFTTSSGQHQSPIPSPPTQDRSLPVNRNPPQSNINISREIQLVQITGNTRTSFDPAGARNHTGMDWYQ